MAQEILLTAGLNKTFLLPMSPCDELIGMTGEHLVDIITRFDANRTAARHSIGELFQKDPNQFWSEAYPLLKEGADGAAWVCLVNALMRNDFLLDRLVDPLLFPLEEAIVLGRHLSRVEPMLDVKLTRKLLDSGPEDKAERTLEILQGLDCRGRIVPMLLKLLHDPRSRIRSKVALLLTRWNHSTEWVTSQLASEDPRVRANALEGLWVDAARDSSLGIFRRAMWDPNPRVVGNALVGLWRGGDPEAVHLLRELARHPARDFRATAAWAMGETQDSRFIEDLQDLAGQAEGKIRYNALRALVRIRKRSSVTPESPSAARLA